MTNLLKELEFIKEIDLLKKIERQTSIHNGGRRENSAEHSWHLATSVFVMKDYAIRPLNLERALLLAIFHDVVEIDAGDTFIYADQTNKEAQEIKTLERLTNLLPQKPNEEIKALWYEYETNSSYEAQFVNALDRFLPMYANYLNDGYSWKKHNIKKSQVIERNKDKIMLGIPKLWDFCEEIISFGVKKGILIDQ